jgi:MoaA/NifB/PqqE/SkfB family radical SAM enzyme
MTWIQKQGFDRHKKYTMKTVTLKKMVRAGKYIMYYSNFSPKPLRIQVDLTDRCNFLCPTCSKWKVKTTGELSTQDWKTVLWKLKGASFSDRITFSGGEALLRKDVIEIVQYAKELGFYVLLISNGFLLTPDKLKTFEEIGLDNLVISLNGINEKTHDASRGVNGSWKRIMTLIPRLKEYDFKSTIETILMGTNVCEIIEMVKMVKENGLYGISFQVLADDKAHYALISDKMENAPRNWYEEDRFWIKDPDKITRVIEELIVMQKQGYPILNDNLQLRSMTEYYLNPQDVCKTKCLAGVGNLNVDPYARVRICYGFEPVGNILEEDPVKIWRSREAQRVREKIKRCGKMCRLLNNNF